MGALSYAALGGLAGLGKGAAAWGETVAKEADVERKLAQQLKLEEMRQDAQDKRLEARLAVTAAKTGTGRSSSGNRGGGGDILDVTADADAWARVSGGDRSKIDDYLALQKGVMPTIAVPVDVEPGDAPVPGGPMQQVAKYSPGSAAALRAEMSKLLNETIKKINPANADDLSKSEQTDQTTGFLADYRRGDVQAGRAALAAQGKTSYGTSGDELTGRAVDGGVSGANVKESLAKANQANAGAGENTAQRDKARAEIDKIKDEREGINPKTSLARAKVEQAAAKTEQVEIGKARDLLFKQFEAGTIELAPGDKDRKAAYLRQDRELRSMMAVEKKREEEARKREAEARDAPTPSSKDTPSKANAPKAEVKGAIVAAVEKGNPVKPAATAKSPYPEGTRLAGPGGKIYVVRNGVPEPMK